MVTVYSVAVTSKQYKTRHVSKVTRSRRKGAINTSQAFREPEYFGGSSEIERLEWAIDVTWNRTELTKDPQRLVTFQTDLAAFCGLASPVVISDIRMGQWRPISNTDAGTLLKGFQRILKRVAERQTVFLPKRFSVGFIGTMWDSVNKRFVAMPAIRSYIDMATAQLFQLILKYGHQIFQCEAPLPHDKALCGKWFATKRKGRRYCSAQCGSRVTSRRNRSSADLGNSRVTQRKKLKK